MINRDDHSCPAPLCGDAPGRTYQCHCGRWWFLRETEGPIVWELMSEADQALHLPGEIGTRDREGYRTFAPPGDVCMGCSDSRTGRWVPVSQCGLAMTAFDKDSAFNTIMDRIRGDFE